MLAVYRVDVLDPAVTPRRLKVLLERLPEGSWPDPASPASWSVEAHLLATLIDALQWNTYATIAPYSKSKPAKPKPIRRPHGADAPAEDGKMTMTALARMLAGRP